MEGEHLMTTIGWIMLAVIIFGTVSGHLADRGG